MKILFIMNYDVGYDWKLWQDAGKTECPTHYLWGITHLAKYGIEVDVLPYEKYKALKYIGHQIKLGDLDQQLRVFLKQFEYDLVYSACQTSTVLLSILSSLGLLKTPIVVKLERPFEVNRLNRILLKVFESGHSKIICLSERTRNQLRDDFGICTEKIPLIAWGPDLPFYDRYKKDVKSFPQFFISAGSTSRDFNTIIQAFSSIDYPLRIYCSGNSVSNISVLPPNVTVSHGHLTEKRALSFRELFAEYENAYAVTIPLDIPESRGDTTTLIGLTSLLETMAMGKAVIMTKHRQANIDIEKEGIGLWVEPGDIEGWKQAVSYLLEHPEETKGMGMRARYLCENKYNLEIFSYQLAAELKSI